jgi:predicted O-methyltransferase YrrM
MLVLLFLMKSDSKFDNISADAAKFIYSLAESSGAKNILELGTSNGYSTYWLAHTKAKITTIEINEERHKLAKENLKNFKNITLILGNSLEIIPKLRDEFDFVFIDAMKQEYLLYLDLLMPKLKQNCIVIADNVISHQDKMQDYLDFVRKNFKSTTVDLDKGLEVTTIFKKS